MVNVNVNINNIHKTCLEFIKKKLCVFQEMIVNTYTYTYGPSSSRIGLLPLLRNSSAFVTL